MEKAFNKIALWQFPEGELKQWQELTGSGLTFQEYQTHLAAVQADLERQGHVVLRVNFSVDEMANALAAANLTNTPDNRALITAQKVKK